MAPQGNAHGTFAPKRHGFFVKVLLSVVALQIIFWMGATLALSQEPAQDVPVFKDVFKNEDFSNIQLLEWFGM